MKTSCTCTNTNSFQCVADLLDSQGYEAMPIDRCDCPCHRSPKGREYCPSCRGLLSNLDSHECITKDMPIEYGWKGWRVVG